MSSRDTEITSGIQNILKDFDKKWGYFYESIFHFLFKGNKFSLLLGYILLLVIWALTSLGCAYSSSLNSVFPDWWWYCAFYCIPLGCPLLFLNAAKNKLRRTLPSIMEILPNEQKRQSFLKHVYFIGNRKRQAIFCIIFGLICFILLSLQRIIIFDSYIVRLHIAFWTFIAGVVSAAGLWTAITSFLMARWFSELTDLRLDFLNQAQTNGVSMFASLMGYYATLFALQVLVWEMPYAYTVIKTPVSPFWDLSSIVFYVSSTIFAAFLAFVLWYFIHPQFRIMLLVKNHKRIILEDIQSRIREIYFIDDHKVVDKASLLGQYLALYKEIHSRRGSLPIQNLLGFGASFSASLALSLAGKIPDLLK